MTTVYDRESPTDARYLAESATWVPLVPAPPDRVSLHGSDPWVDETPSQPTRLLRVHSRSTPIAADTAFAAQRRQVRSANDAVDAG